MKIKGIGFLLPNNIKIPEMEFEKGIIIRELTQDEKDKMIKEVDNSGGSFEDYQKVPNSCIEINFEQEPMFNPETIAILESEFPSSKIEKKIKDVLFALRLFKNGTIGCNKFEIYYDEGYLGTDHISWGFYGEGYEIKEDEKSKLASFYDEIKNLSNIEFLDLAIRRFNSYYERPNPEDKLIDVFVALESLFLEDPQELSYRLSLSISSYLSDEKLRRTDIFNDVREAYKIRNKVVHGEKIKLGKIMEHATKMEDYLRETIKTAFIGKQGKNRTQFLEYVHNRMPYSNN